MNDIRDAGDRLVAEYLDSVRRAAAGLAPQRVDELVDDLREHIATARSELSPETEAEVRTLLDRLGDPAAIVAEAAIGEPPAAPSSLVTLPQAPAGDAPPRRTNRTLVVVLVVLAAICMGVPVLGCAAYYLGSFAVFTNQHQPEPAVNSVQPPSSSPT
jgi:hypothetical protein